MSFSDPSSHLTLYNPPMKITGTWLRHPGTQEVLRRLEAAGHQALAVGGCVRNDLLGLPISDIDIATSAKPDAILLVFDDLRCVPTGLDHGTVTVIADGVPHEVTTFREDIDTDGRRATVRFGTDVAHDAARRDFTVNALYARAGSEVVDPLGGLPDLKARRIRFIGIAEDRIREDYLRILRFFRFTAHYAAEIDAEGLAACANLQEGLEHISAERIGQEMRKLLAAPDPGPAVAAMAQSGLLTRVLPGADATALPVLIHLEESRAPDWIRRLALLGGDISNLRLSRAETRDTKALVETARDARSGFALGHTLGVQRGMDAALIRAALLSHPPDLSEIAVGAAAEFPLKAADLAPRTGPQLGQALSAARAHWLSTRGTADARALLNWLDKHHK